MNKKGLAILLRTRMRPPSDPSKFALSPLPASSQMVLSSQGNQPDGGALQREGTNKLNGSSNNIEREFDSVRESMHSAISMSKTEVLDGVLDDFSQGYSSLSFENRRKLLLLLAKAYDLNRMQVREHIKQYLGLEFPSGELLIDAFDDLNGAIFLLSLLVLIFCELEWSEFWLPGKEGELSSPDEEGILSAFYRTERNLRQALKPTYDVLFERLNNHPGGLKVLSIVRADILSILDQENISSLRALDSYLKEKLGTWLSPAALELHQITWDDPASLLEKIVAFEAVHPISNLLDLKRRLGIGRRCFGYLHPAIADEPLIFIEVALLKNVAHTIQEVLWKDPPIPESEATCALFYSISSTQPGLAGINLGKFLIKRVITLVKRDMPHISTFATLSPIPGYMQWLLSKLASQSLLAEAENTSESLMDRSGSTFWENLLEPDEERILMNSTREVFAGKNGMEVMLNLLTSRNYEWTSSEELLSALKPPLMRLCARYLLQEKKRGKALDSVQNFHLQNGAMIERINWMADQSENGLRQSGGIMVNYVYRIDNIEEFAQSYLSAGRIHASGDIQCHVTKGKDHELPTDGRNM